MSPEIINEKINRIVEYLKVLEKYQDISFQDFSDEKHYTIERILELLVTTATDLLMHKMVVENESLPTTMRATFLRAGELKWLPSGLAENLANAAAMRNLLVHGYEKVDLAIIYKSIRAALRDYAAFVERMLIV